MYSRVRSEDFASVQRRAAVQFKGEKPCFLIPCRANLWHTNFCRNSYPHSPIRYNGRSSSHQDHAASVAYVPYEQYWRPARASRHLVISSGRACATNINALLHSVHLLAQDMNTAYYTLDIVLSIDSDVLQMQMQMQMGNMISPSV